MAASKMNGLRIVMGTMTFSAQTPKVAATEMTMTLTGKYKELAYAVPELDTARMYNEGLTEVCVGEILNEACPELKASDGIKVATKANPTEGLSAEKVKAQLNKSLEALNMDSVDIFYLHLPDPKVKIEESLESVQALYEEGKFKRFGLSNYSAWEVVYIHAYMKARGWVLPVVYQGMLNGITRTTTEDLLPALRRLNMSFYAYNPLAGGVLTGKHKRGAAKPTGQHTRFTSDTAYGKMYQDRFMKEEHYSAVEMLLEVCEKQSISLTDAALRWCMHHSGLEAAYGDSIIIGASSLEHFYTNMDALEGGPLPQEIVDAFDAGWAICKPVVAPYARAISGSDLITKDATSGGLRIVMGTMTFSDQTPKDAATEMTMSLAGKYKELAYTIPELDSARVYCGGLTEICVGEILNEACPELKASEGISIATKANPSQGLSTESVKAQLNKSLGALNMDSVDIFYLHAPDAKVKIEESLEGVQALYEEGKFKRFGLSNYSAWEVAYIHGYMKAKGWVIPVLYQGMLNGITRTTTENLLPALRRLNMSFYCYNPLAGGMLTGKHKRGVIDPADAQGRFNSETRTGKMYIDRFMKEEHYSAVEILLEVCEKQSISLTDAALRWCMHHSGLEAAYGDSIIIGASSLEHFYTNMDALEGGPLPQEIVDAFDAGWAICKPVVAPYARGISGSAV